MNKQRNWGSAAAMLIFAGFVAMSLWAKWNPAVADDKAPPAASVQAKPAASETPKGARAKGAQAKGKGTAQKQAAKKKSNPAEFTRAVPGAGKKLDALALAKIIDQEINQALKSEGI